MYKQFELAEELVKEKRAWLKEKEELSARIEKSELVNMRVLEERNRLQSALLKRGTELDKAISGILMPRPSTTLFAPAVLSPRPSS